MERSQITVIIPAAGRSRRMGTIKQLLPLDQSTLLHKTISNLTACPLTDILVVLGYEAEKIRPHIQDLPVSVLINENFDEGMSSSIKCGLERLKPSCGSILIALGDQPFISTQLVNRLIEGYLNSDKSIAYPVHKGRKGHPVILDRKYEAEIRLLGGDTGCRQILDDHPDDHLTIEVDDEKIFWDIDYPEDYRLLKKQGHIK